MRNVQQLLDLFENHLTVMAMAEPLLIFSMETYQREMEERRYETAVLIYKGQLLKFDKGDTSPQAISTADTLPSRTSIFEAFKKLLEKRRYFILTPQGITHIVTRSDLDKIPIRLGIFGLLSVFETFLKEKVRSEYMEVYQFSLTETRLGYAKELFREKIRKNEDIDLIECLQLGDLRTVFSKEKRYCELLPDLKRVEYDRRLRAIVRLRDSLAHAQPSLPYSWPEIYELVTFMKAIMQVS